MICKEGRMGTKFHGGSGGLHTFQRVWWVDEVAVEILILVQRQGGKWDDEVVGVGRSAQK